jgi:hypothetical protein
MAHEKLGLSKALPTICIERIQIDGSAAQLKSFVKAAENGCRGSRKSYNLGISGFESNRPLAKKTSRNRRLLEYHELGMDWYHFALIAQVLLGSRSSLT